MRCKSSPLQTLKLNCTHLRPLLLLHGHGHEHLVLGWPLKNRTRTGPAKAIASSFIVAATSSPMSPDAPVLIQTGGLLLFTFWFFNFFVTDQISKLYGFDKLDEDEETIDGNPSADKETGSPLATIKASSTIKKQGFVNTKPKTKTKTKTKT